MVVASSRRATSLINARDTYVHVHVDMYMYIYVCTRMSRVLWARSIADVHPESGRGSLRKAERCVATKMSKKFTVSSVPKTATPSYDAGDPAVKAKGFQLTEKSEGVELHEPDRHYSFSKVSTGSASKFMAFLLECVLFRSLNCLRYLPWNLYYLTISEIIFPIPIRDGTPYSNDVSTIIIVAGMVRYCNYNQLRAKPWRCTHRL